MPSATERGVGRVGGRGGGGGGRRRGIAAFEEIPTSGRKYPTANSRTVDDDDQLASDSTAVQKLMMEVRIVGEDVTW